MGAVARPFRRHLAKRIGGTLVDVVLAVSPLPAVVALARARRRAAAVRRAVVRAERRRAVGAAPAVEALALAGEDAVSLLYTYPSPRDSLASGMAA